MATKTSKNWKRICKIVIITAVVVFVIVPAVVLAVSKYFTAQEHTVRTDWTFETGDIIAKMDEWQVDFAEAELGDGLRAVQLVPRDIQEDGFTYYDMAVQERLEGALESMKNSSGASWTATTPLAVLNPYGTGSNGLYLYFETERATAVSYTIRVDDDDIPDFTAAAADADDFDIYYIIQALFKLKTHCRCPPFYDKESFFDYQLPRLRALRPYCFNFTSIYSILQQELANSSKKT